MFERSPADVPPACAWLDRLIAPLAPGARILDLGCGGGEPIARYLVDRGFLVTGVDLAASQILVAQTRFPQHRWLRADMRHVDLPERFDAVVAWNSLTWLGHADRATVATRAAGWLAPGGRLLFNAPADDDPTREEYRAGSPYRAELDELDYGAMLRRLGLVEVAHVVADPACDGASIWLAYKPMPAGQMSPASGLDGSA